MISIGNLSAHGLSIFLDRDMRHELTQESEVDMKSGEVLDFFIGVRHSTGNSNRIGKLLILEEEFKTLMIDFVKSSGDTFFRSYDAIEKISIDVEFDRYSFIRNFLLDNSDRHFLYVIEMLRMRIFGNMDEYKTCVYRGTYDICGCDESRREVIFEPHIGEGGYNFFRDFYRKDGVLSLWNQWLSTEMVRTSVVRKYLNNGVPGFNYINNVYPEQTELLDYRWGFGGYSINDIESDHTRTFVYRRFLSWYNSTFSGWGGLGAESTYLYNADEATVVYMTNIAKTEYYDDFLAEKSVLESLLGPEHCVQLDPETGFCSMYEYGTTFPSSSSEGEDLPLNSFMALRKDGFSTMDYDFVTEYYDGNANGVTPMTAMYVVKHFNGKIGGKYIFRGGTGNEHRYYEPFHQFLEEQKWTIDDFMAIYSDLIGDAMDGINNSVSEGSHTHPRDFCEFYDKNHFSPFDNAKIYIPVIPSMQKTRGGVPVSNSNYTKVSKKKITYFQDGSFSVSDAGEVILDGDIRDITMNAGEFISSVYTVGGLSTIVSDYMRIKVSLHLKDSFASEDGVNMRIAVNDFTYLSERHFNYVTR